MSDQIAREKQFDYPSNLVIQREPRGPRMDEPTGEPETLVGRIDPRLMGTLASREKPKKLVEKTKKEKETTAEGKKKQAAEQSIMNPKKKTKIPISTGSNVMNVNIKENTLYEPKTKENRIIYEQILAKIYTCLDNETQETLIGVCDEVLAVLNTENMKDKEKFQTIEAILGKISQEFFSELINLAKQLTDYSADVEENIDKYDEEIRIPVVIEQEEAKVDESDEENIGENTSDEDEGDKTEEDDDEEDRGIKALRGEEEDEMDIEDDKFNIDVSQIDAYWLQTQLNKHFNDPVTAQKMENEIMRILNAPSDIDCENKLVMLLNYDKFDLIKLLKKNRYKIYYCTRLGQSQSAREKEEIFEEMRRTETGEAIIERLETVKIKKDKEEENIKKVKKEAVFLSKISKGHQNDNREDALELLDKRNSLVDEDFSKMVKKYIDLDSITFNQGNHFMSNEKCQLPPGSYRLTKKGYDEVGVPAVVNKSDNVKLINVSTLPEWTRPAFPSDMKTLNRIQSEVYPVAFGSPENMLVCAPTGAGKTNIALFTMLQIIGNYRKRDGSIDRSKFKMVYIAPMKALVGEMVGNFSQRLEPFGIVVKELTGDMQLTKQQIEETQLIVATPEKWDIITRKSGDRTYTELVKLLIIDEIHLLHDLRGPVLEALVSRTIRMIESTQEMIRIIGLSATLPNYADVGAFLRVKSSGLFYFDNTYRPVPLEQIYIGITEKKAVRKMFLMNEILYEKVIDRAGTYQMIIFVNSRRETIKTAKALKEMALSKDELNKFLKEGSDSRIVLQEEAETNVKNTDLKELLPFGFAIHHAGLARTDRKLVEDLFGDKHIQVLVSTATLAWGVNLPAHTVIIKGTQIYSPEQGKWVELSPQDILQMMGRAGRPAFDKKGEGIIITSYQELKYYLSLLNQQLPIESQFITHLADQLNSEIVLGSLMSTRDAVNWLGYTYLYVRMMRSPHTYSISDDEISADPMLVKRRADLIHSAATILDKHNLIKYDKKTGIFQSTALGKIASHYYIKYPSIAIYNEHIKPNMGIIELFKVFSLSSEFKFIPIREEEKLELQKLMESVPLPIKGSAEDPTTKINVLLQAYISRSKLEGLALNSDMVYVTQSAGRLMRGLFEIFLRRGWAHIAKIALNVCKMVDKRMWSCMTPLRQFRVNPQIPEEILRRIEKKEQFTWDHFYSMNPQQIGDLIKFPKYGKTLHKYIHQFPRIELVAFVQPITRSCLKIDLTVTPDFHWDDKIHGKAEPFWIFVEDCDGELILYCEQFILKQKYLKEKEYTFEFTVPLFEPLHPIYYIRVISDRWIQAEAQLPVSFKNLILPEKFPAPTELLDLVLMPVNSFKWPEAEKLFENMGIKTFNSIQTQVFGAFFNSDENIFLGSSTGSGKTVCILFSILRAFKTYKEGEKIVYLAPLEAIAKFRFKQFSKMFRLFKKNVGLLTGQITVDMQIVEKSNVIIAQPEHWDVVSRRWKHRKVLHQVRLFIVDELHLLDKRSAVMEVVVSRMRYISSHIERPCRIVGISTSLANYRDVAEWIGASTSFTFNFPPHVRPIPLEIFIHGFDQNNRHSRLLAMEKYMYQGIKQHARERPVLIFVSDRKQARLTALELVTLTHSDGDFRKFLLIPEGEIGDFTKNIKEKNLRHVLAYGVAFIYEGMDEAEREVVEQLFNVGAIQVLICTYNLCWEISQEAYMVIVLDTQRYDGQEHRYIDYTVPDMLQMMGRASKNENGESPKCLVFCHTPKKDFYKKFLFEPLPLESSLTTYIADHLNAEIVSKTIETKQDCVDWITWSFLYRRLTMNPNFYNLQEVSGSHINDYLSELIENTVEELEKAKCIAVENETELLPLNSGIIAGYYYIKYSTIQEFSEKLTANSKMRQLLDILAGATEFEMVPIRHREDTILKGLCEDLNYKIEKAKFNEPHTKANILLQCHFSRTRLTPDFYWDQKMILEHSIRLIQAMVDVLSSECWLKPAILCMQLCQMVVQALWVSDSPLLQLPHFNKKLVEAFKSKGVEDLSDFINMDDEERKALLNLSEAEILEMADFCNHYPTVSLDFKVRNADKVKKGANVSVDVKINREGEDFKPFVHAPYFPKEKEELWWVLVGDAKNNNLNAIKRFNFQASHSVELKFVAPEEGNHDLNIYLICDSFLGCDHVEKFKLKVQKADKEQDVEEEGEEEK